MTKLKQSIFDAMVAGNGEFADYDNLSGLAAEVCKGYIERALTNYNERLTEVLHVNGELGQSDINLCKEYVIHWLKSEGITE